MTAPDTPTFLFTDIEGSTRLWDEHPEEMGGALTRHNAIIRQAIADQDGEIFATAGDSFSAAFESAEFATEAALSGQLEIHEESWDRLTPIRVRMAIHSGPARRQDDDYLGPTLNRTARLLDAGHGGQILISKYTVDLLADAIPREVEFRDLGEHRLRDLSSPERIFQLIHPALPARFRRLRTLDQYGTNLPVQLTSFVGRRQELAEVAGLLDQARLITLMGVGGAGKTRLALQVAAESLDDFQDGVWLVSLGELTEGALVPQVAARALGLGWSDGSPHEALVSYLRSRRALLILDNCEHVLDDAASFSDQLLAACPEMRVMATSRAALGVSGERTYVVPALSLPDPDGEVGDSEAVRLFVDRAAQARPGFELDSSNTDHILEICRRLEGLPLAIELAAARVKVLSPDQITNRLSDRFALLTQGSRTALPHQRALLATMDWSYELLTTSEQRVLRRLAVFRGGFTLEAAEGVTAAEDLDESAILDVVLHLVDQSLVVPGERDGSVRYRLYETVRQYALAKLAEKAEEEAVRDRHVSHFLEFAESAERAMRGPSETGWLLRIDADIDNLRVALSTSLGSAHPDQTVRIATALATYWDIRGQATEGIRWLTQATGQAEGVPSLLIARATSELGNLLRNVGSLDKAGAALQSALEALSGLNLPEEEATAQLRLALVATSRGDYEMAERLLTKAQTGFERAGSDWGRAACIGRRGDIARFHSDLAEARRLYGSSLHIYREIEHGRGIAQLLTSLGSLAVLEADYDLASRLYEESLAGFRESGSTLNIAQTTMLVGRVATLREEFDWAFALFSEAAQLTREARAFPLVGDLLGAWALLARRQGRLERTARLRGAQEIVRERLELSMDPDTQALYESEMAALRAQLDAETLARCWEEGRKLPWGEALDFAVGGADE